MENKNDREFIIKADEKKLEEILKMLEGKFRETIPKERRLHVGDEYLTTIMYLGEKKYLAEQELISLNIDYEVNKTVYKKG